MIESVSAVCRFATVMSRDQLFTFVVKYTQHVHREQHNLPFCFLADPAIRLKAHALACLNLLTYLSIYQLPAAKILKEHKKTIHRQIYNPCRYAEIGL